MPPLAALGSDVGVGDGADVAADVGLEPRIDRFGVTIVDAVHPTRGARPQAASFRHHVAPGSVGREGGHRPDVLLEGTWRKARPEELAIIRAVGIAHPHRIEP